MKLFAIADLHLSFGVPGKSMAKYGPLWHDHPNLLAKRWREVVTDEDLVLIPGDISWAKTLREARDDLDFLESLPGTKVLGKGNHDYWWPSLKKLRELPYHTLHFVEASALDIPPYTIAGVRLWDTEEIEYSRYSPQGFIPPPLTPKDHAIYARELQRLDKALEQLNPHCPHRIVMTHYPPIGPDNQPTKASERIERIDPTHIVFGHLHGLTPFPSYAPPYHLVSLDARESRPLHLG